MKNLEEKILEISAKLGNEVHLKAIRNTFISMLPIMIFGGIFAVIGAAPATENATGFMKAWADFVSANSAVFSWVSVLGLGFTSLYIALGITYNLCKEYKVDPLIPLFICIFGIWNIFNRFKLFRWKRNYCRYFCRDFHCRNISYFKTEKFRKNQIAR